MKKAIENINLVLTEWNPIGVPDDIAKEEYKSYIPLILQSIDDRKRLMNCLEDILINKIEIDYDSTNREHSEDLQLVCDKLIRVYQKAKGD
jgi:hypothetical protein